MRTVLILPYFGKFPNYFNLYLHTIRANPTIQWLLFTNDERDYNFPSNVTIFYMSFEKIQQLFQSKFEFKISLDSPFKLCDFRPAFGYIFQDFIKEYDYWGHCDPDLLWGNFNNFIDWKVLFKYDKVFCFGHLAFYKNSNENNKRFMLSINGKEKYKTVFSHQIGFAFDEKFGESINQIYKENGFPVFFNNVAADIDSYSTNMRLSVYDYELNTFTNEKINKQIFTWEEGNVYRYYFKEKKIIKEEFLYIHLQKRAMKFNFDEDNYSKILIASNEFIPLLEEITADNFNKYYKKKWFNSQYFKVKWNSLKYRIKYKLYK